MKRVWKWLKWMITAGTALFGLSLIVYFFNLDMKLAVHMKKFMDFVYDRRERDRRL